MARFRLWNNRDKQLEIRARTPAPDKIKTVTSFLTQTLGALDFSYTAGDSRITASEALSSHFVINAALRLLMDSVAQVKWEIKIKQTNGVRVLADDTHPLVKLLEKPNPYLTGRQMVAMATGYYFGYGNAVITKIRPRKGEPPLELWTHNPDKLKPQWRKNKQNQLIGLDGFNFGTDYNPRVIPMSEFIHAKNMSLDNPFWGVSDLRAALKLVDVDNSTRNWLDVVMSNGAVITGVLAVKNILKREQKEDIEDSLRERKAGGEKAGEALVIGADTSFHPISQSPSDTKAIDTLKLSAQDIAVAIRVNPIVLNIVENATYSNAKEYHTQFWLTRVIPIIQEIEAALNTQLAADFGDNVRIAANVNHIEALVDNTLKKVEGFSTLARTGVKPWAAAQALNMPLEEADVYDGYLGNYAQETGVLNNVPDLGTRVIAGKADTYIKRKPAQQWTKAERASYWKATDREREDYEQGLEIELARAMRKESQDVYNAILSDDSLDEALAASQIYYLNVLKSAYYRGVALFGKKRTNEILAGHGYRLEFEITSGISDAIKNRVAAQVKLISETTREKLREIIIQATKDGLDREGLAKAIKDQYDVWSKLKYNYNNEGHKYSRAAKIARTESGIIQNTGKHEAAVQVKDKLGVDIAYTWFDSGKGNVRASHQISGETVKMGDLFSNGLLHPNDPNGPAREIINCNCSYVAEIDTGQIIYS